MKAPLGPPCPKPGGGRVADRVRGLGADQLRLAVLLGEPPATEQGQCAVQFGHRLGAQPGGEQHPRPVDGDDRQQLLGVHGETGPRGLQVAQRAGDVTGQQGAVAAVVHHLGQQPIHAEIPRDRLAAVQVGRCQPDTTGDLVQHGPIQQRPGEHLAVQQRDRLVHRGEAVGEPADEQQQQPTLLQQQAAVGRGDQALRLVQQAEAHVRPAALDLHRGKADQDARGHGGIGRLVRPAQQPQAGTQQAATGTDAAHVDRADAALMQLPDPGPHGRHLIGHRASGPLAGTTS